MTFKQGDKVKGYNHVYSWAKDGWVGTYHKPSSDHPGAHVVSVPAEGLITYQNVVLVDERSEVDIYKQDVLLPALERKNKQHNWCGEYDEFLKEVGIDRPKLPIGKNALVEVTSFGATSVLRRSNLNSNEWVDGGGIIWSNLDVQKSYTRTIFEGE